MFSLVPMALGRKPNHSNCSIELHKAGEGVKVEGIRMIDKKLNATCKGRAAICVVHTLSFN